MVGAQKAARSLLEASRLRQAGVHADAGAGLRLREACSSSSIRCRHGPPAPVESFLGSFMLLFVSMSLAW
jgi:hypothetical protein